MTRTTSALVRLIGVALVVAFPVTANAQIKPEEARAIAKDAYIYGYPMVDSYRIQYAYFVDTKNPEYKAPWNQIKNMPRVFTPDDKAVQTPNSDTPYSMLGLDLRAEPIVPTVPSEKELMTRFAKIGVGAGKTFEASKLTPELKRAIEDGMADAWVDLAKLQKRVDAKEVTSGDMFGTREYLKNNYLYRMAASHPSELEAKWLGCRRLSDQFTRRCSRRRGACRLYRTRHSVAAPAAAELGRQSTKHLRDSATIFRKVLNNRNWRTNTQDEPL